MNNTGLAGGAQQNNVGDRPSHNRSKFPLSYNLCHTARFGEINSHFTFDAVRMDNVPLRSEHDLRTYSFKAPLMQDIEIHKAYFNVPYECILPINWEKILVQPNIGDDIDAQAYGVSVEKFYQKTFNVQQKLYEGAINIGLNVRERATLWLRFLELGALWYSRGSLMWQIGYHGELVFVKIGNYQERNFDEIFDETIAKLVAELGQDGAIVIKQGETTYRVVNNGNILLKSKISAISVREFLDMIAHEADWEIVEDEESDTILGSWIEKEDNEIFNNYNLRMIAQADKKPINLSRILAYQLACSHYFSNDAVDYIYSAELYRQNMYSLSDMFNQNYTGDKGWYNNLAFNYNGVHTNVDYLSAAVFNRNYELFVGIDPVTDAISLNAWPYYQYLINMFQFQNSLRYRDYFTGSRTRPLAVGNVDIEVDTTNNVVNVVDITRNIQLQRFLNSVNRTGRKFANYLEGLIAGKDVGYDYHNPQFLAHVEDKAYAIEVENTGEAQQTNENSVTAVVKSNSSRYAFEFQPDRPSVIVGVEYFDIPRNYAHVMEKQLFHVDRFDMFNPDMQFIGDQPVEGAELSMDNNAEVFGYQLRYAEYKQRVNVCVGGFVDNLPGYIFKASEDAFAHHYANGEVKMSPFYIRSHPFELDSFYLSLTGWSPGSYFHFIVKAHNDMTATRPMAAKPTIL